MLTFFKAEIYSLWTHNIVFDTVLEKEQISLLRRGFKDFQYLVTQMI